MGGGQKEISLPPKNFRERLPLQSLVELTDVAVLAEPSGKERHGGKQP